MRRRPRAWLAWLLAAIVAGTLHAQAATPGVVTIDRAEAVQTGWQSTAPPATGWEPVTLLDYWNKRWPKHDGVVWYRLHWHQAGNEAPVGVLVSYVNMADAVWANGSLLHRDAQLVEPLSRSWNTPQYFLIDRPVLRTGDNTLLVRVAGYARYRPGFGAVRIGEPQAVRREWQHEVRWRYDSHLFNMALGLVLGALFGMLWLLRRKDTVYGWYALNALCAALYGWNYISTSTWPFPDTDARQAFFAAMFVAVTTSFAVFLLRFREHRMPRTETALGVFCTSAFAFALFAPHLAGPWRSLWILPAAAIYYIAIAAFLWQAARTPRTDWRVLGACLLLPVAVSFHDLAAYLQLIHGANANLDALTSPLTLIGMSFIVAWHFSAAMRRVEGFNLELRREVDAATTQLTDTLARQHALALAHTRAGERLNLVRDLHDGFGGSLLGAITELEHAPPTPETAHTIGMLKELRDDLRLVIDTTTHEQDLDLAGLLAPLCHRWSQRLDIAGTDYRWQLDNLDGLHLGSARSLDLLRFVQEALTNVLKHSHASRVDIRVQRESERLVVEVRDDGRGFDPAAHAHGASLASLRARTARLGGEFALHAAPAQGVALRLDTPLPPA